MWHSTIHQTQLKVLDKAIPFTGILENSQSTDYYITLLSAGDMLCQISLTCREISLWLRLLPFAQPGEEITTDSLNCTEKLHAWLLSPVY